MTDGGKKNGVGEPSVGASVVKPELSPPVPGGKVTSVLLNGRNFAAWSRSFRLFVGGRGKMSWLLGKMPRPADDDPTLEQWNIDNWTILGWFFSSMEPSIFNMFMYHETADSLWKALTKMYAHSHNEARIFELHQEISHASQESLGLSVSEFFGYLQVRWDELAQYDPVSDFGETAHVAVKRLDRLHTYFFLMGLKSDFENLRAQILNTSPLPSLLDTFAIVDGDEHRHLIYTPTPSPEKV